MLNPDVGERLQQASRRRAERQEKAETLKKDYGTTDDRTRFLKFFGRGFAVPLKRAKSPLSIKVRFAAGDAPGLQPSDL
jgi:hypothetical protein